MYSTNESFYFICEPLVDLEKYPGANTDYQHCIVCLAEGLSEMGFTCYGNINYWQEDVGAEYFIKKNENLVGHKAIIVSSHWLIKHDAEKILHKTPPDTPLFLMADMQEEAHLILSHPLLPHFHKVFLCGYVSAFKYPANIVPWAFGLSNRIIRETEKNYQDKRDYVLLWNFRMGHTSRNLAKKFIAPSLSQTFQLLEHIDNEIGTSDYDLLMDRQTGRRHYPSYFTTLGHTKALVAIGGYFALVLSENRFSLLNKIAFKMTRAFAWKGNALIQHDSWRLWEGLAAGCIVFHANFDEMQVVYPLAFEHNKHYIGIPKKFFKKHTRKSFDDFLASIDMVHIGTHGREFALTHYSPKPVAKRFLEYL